MACFILRRWSLQVRAVTPKILMGELEETNHSLTLFLNYPECLTAGQAPEGPEGQASVSNPVNLSFLLCRKRTDHDNTFFLGLLLELIRK